MGSSAKHANGTNISNAANRIGERTRLACTLRRLAGKHVLGEPPNTAGRRPALPGILMLCGVNITSFFQLRESDLLGPDLLRGVASPSSHSPFCEEVFSLALSVAALCERRIAMSHRTNPAVIDRRYSRTDE